MQTPNGYPFYLFRCVSVRVNAMKANDFHSNLAKRRKELGLTQEQLAGRMNVSAQAVSKWEKNSFPDAALLVRLADTLNISLDTLFGRDFSEDKPDLETAVSRAFRSASPKQRPALFMRMMYTAVCTYHPSWESVGRLPEDFACETFAVLKADTEQVLMRLDSDLRYACFLEVPEEGVGPYLGDTLSMRRLFYTLADENALRMVAYLGNGARNQMYTADGIAKNLGIPAEDVRRILNRMERFGLVWRMKADIAADDFLYGNTHKIPLTMLLILAKTITNYIRNINPGVDLWHRGAFRDFAAEDIEPLPNWEDDEL